MRLWCQLNDRCNIWPQALGINVRRRCVFYTTESGGLPTLDMILRRRNGRCQVPPELIRESLVYNGEAES